MPGFWWSDNGHDDGGGLGGGGSAQLRLGKATEGGGAHMFYVYMLLMCVHTAVQLYMYCTCRTWFRMIRDRPTSSAVHMCFSVF